MKTMQHLGFATWSCDLHLLRVGGNRCHTEFSTHFAFKEQLCKIHNMEDEEEILAKVGSCRFRRSSWTNV